MIYKIKTKESVENYLLDLYKEKLILDINQNGDFMEFDITIENDEQFNDFVRIVAEHLSYFCNEEFLKKALLKKKKPDEEIQQILQLQKERIGYSDYFFKNTQVLLKEYLKNNNQIYLESFALFNMKGVKQEIEQMVEDLEFVMNFDEDFFDFAGIDVLESPEEIFEVIKSQINEMGLEMEKIEELNIYENNGNLVIKDINRNIIDNNYLLTEFGVVLDIELDSNANKEDFKIQEAILFLLCVINVFGVSKLVVHKTVRESTLKLLKENMTDFKALNKDIKIEYCKGCSDCE